jgi:Siphovirus ReqiPepy6 Gp37-like protein
MELYILNKSFETVAVIDQYTSLIWTKRYWDTGDFELYLPADDSLLQYLQIDYYITRKDCDTTMMIERIEIKTDAESGNYFTISGRSAEKILSYRVVANASHGFGTSSAERMCYYLVAFEMTNKLPDTLKYADRTIDIIKDIRQTSTHKNPDESVIWNSYYYENLSDAVYNLATQYGFSVRFLLRDDRTGFDIEFWSGKDRTTGQTTNSPVVFSPGYYNLINSDYAYDITDEKTMAFIAGQGDGANRVVLWTHMTVTDDEEHTNVPRGLDRREMFVDARDLQQTSSDGATMSWADYQHTLRYRGKEKLYETVATPLFSGEVDTTLQFVYRRDWDLGDIVSIENEYGISASARIVEVVECDDENGYKVTPTFSDWEVD